MSISNELGSLVQIASAAATSADGHANTVSVRAVSISNELGSLVQIASAAATSADAHANTVSARVVSVSAELVSLLVSAAPKKGVNTANQASITVSTGLTVSGVSVALVAGQTYSFQFQIPFTCMLSSGIVVAVVGPAATSYYATYKIPGVGADVATSVPIPAFLGSASQITPLELQVRAIGTKVSTASITLTGVTLMAEAYGIINPSGSGSIKFVIGPNTSGGTNSGVIVLQGANVRVWRMA